MECAEVKKQQGRDDFAFRHPQGAISVRLLPSPDWIWRLLNSLVNSLQKSSTIQKISVILSGVSGLILFCYLVDIHFQR
jgi:hypothetical protein